MTTYTLHDLAYAKGTSEPVRQMLLAMQEKIEKLEAKRQWVGLTPEEVKEISLANRPYVVDMVVALEKRLKEKNT